MTGGQAGELYGAASGAMRLSLVVGTRPEAIKLVPVALAARARGWTCRIVLTGQHERLAIEALAEFGLTADHVYSGGPRHEGLSGLECALEGHLRADFAAHPPDVALVQGDTASAIAGARAAHALGVTLGHVEAGLRSYDLARPFPEEGYRIEIDQLADLLFAPTPEAAANLAAESEARGAVIVTGNTGIDALLHTRARIAPCVAEGGRRLVLVTCHRRENIGAGVAGVCEAVRRLAARGDAQFAMPIHPNPAVAGPMRAALEGLSGVRLTPPLDHRAMVAAMAGAYFVLSDSGGLQEEAPALGVPMLVLREVTERPEGLACGSLKLVGTDPDRIVCEAARLLDDPIAHAAMAQPRFPYGDGRAAERILNACAAFRSVRTR